VRYRATVAYDGRAYWGFQRQAGDAPTVQGAIERALEQITGTHTPVIGAGRTDSGVHATGQVIAFDAEWAYKPETLTKALNATLPTDISVRDVCEHPGFHPRFDARSRCYRYTVHAAAVRDPLLWGRVWWLPKALDVEAMQACAASVIGTHDFATFGRPPQGDNTVRTVFASQWSHRAAPIAGELYVYEVEANAFLHHMVRRLVGMMVDAGRRWLSPEMFQDKMRAADLNLAQRTAPPHGLVLEAVRYDD